MASLHEATGVRGPSAPPGKRRGRPKGWNTLAVRARREERIGQALELRKAGLSYSRIAATMNVNVSQAWRWVQGGLAGLPSEATEELRSRLLDQCNAIMQALTPRLREGGVGIDSMLKTQERLRSILTKTGASAPRPDVANRIP